MVIVCYSETKQSLKKHQSECIQSICESKWNIEYMSISDTTNLLNAHGDVFLGQIGCIVHIHSVFDIYIYIYIYIYRGILVFKVFSQFIVWISLNVLKPRYASSTLHNSFCFVVITWTMLPVSHLIIGKYKLVWKRVNEQGSIDQYHKQMYSYRNEL